jgi:hypothetical protein
MPAIAIEMFLLFYYNLPPQHVSAPTDNLQVERNINHHSMVERNKKKRENIQYIYINTQFNTFNTLLYIFYILYFNSLV